MNKLALIISTCGVYLCDVIRRKLIKGIRSSWDRQCVVLFTE
uniref:Uncharacterized protein n=1 Tax=Microplitis mediator bracovirus TaxID=1836595 RepID=A0A2I6SGU6_9VIRU|nr:hypothetical protein MmBV_CMP1 [Microplitis mediator bracovirus]